MTRKFLPSLCMIFLLALSLALPSFGTAESGESFDASTMRLLNHSGDVQILDEAGVPRFVLENVRFASGETMVTGEDSLASVGLDDSKIVTLDALTRVGFVREGEHMLLNLLEGQVFIDVSEKLDENATFDIQTTTLSVGIRGTLIFGRILPAEKPGDPTVTEFGVLEGAGEIDTTDSSGTRRVFRVEAGELVTAEETGDGGGASFAVREMTAADTQGFVQEVVNGSETLQQRVVDGSLDDLGDDHIREGSHGRGRDRADKVAFAAFHEADDQPEPVLDILIPPAAPGPGPNRCRSSPSPPASSTTASPCAARTARWSPAFRKPAPLT